MGAYCIPQEIGKNLKAAVARGEIKLKDLASMDPLDQQIFFEKYAPAKTASMIRNHFSQAVEKGTVEAFNRWATKTFNPANRDTTIKLVRKEFNNTLKEAAKTLPFAEVNNLRKAFNKVIADYNPGRIEPNGEIGKIAGIFNNVLSDYTNIKPNAFNSAEINNLKEVFARNLKRNARLQEIDGVSETLKDLQKNLSKGVMDIADQEAIITKAVKKQMGLLLPEEDMKNIIEFHKDAQEAKAKIEKGGDRMEYGLKMANLKEYVDNINLRTGKKNLKDIITDPVGMLSEFADMTKALNATGDNSILLNQGMKTLLTNPEIWAKNSTQSFVDIAKTVGGKNILKYVYADIISRPNSLNGLYKQEKLAVFLGDEEAIPTSFLERIPGIGRGFKASEVAYTAWAQRTRADLFDKYVQIAENTGADIDGVGRMVNSLTGRGNLGRAEAVAGWTNKLFFSARNLKSHFDVLLFHPLGISQDVKFGSFAQKKAAENLLKIVAGQALILGTAKALGARIELDPRSSDFGTIGIGDTSFDISGGVKSIIVLAARLLPLVFGAEGATKSTTTGKITKLNSDEFGAKTGLDVLVEFTRGKASPIASAVINQLVGKNYDFEKPTVSSAAYDLFTPMPIKNFIKNHAEPGAANIVLTTLASFLGVSTNTYKRKFRGTNNVGSTKFNFSNLPKLQ